MMIRTGISAHITAIATLSMKECHTATACCVNLNRPHIDVDQSDSRSVLITLQTAALQFTQCAPKKQSNCTKSPHPFSLF